MKKYTLPVAAAMLALSLTACACSGEEAQSSAAAPAASAAPAAVQQAAPGSHKILIAYFAYGENAAIPDGADASASASIQPTADGMTGNTGLVAREIQKSAGGELFSIRTEAPYPASYDATVEQGRQEQQQNARPALASHIEDPASYDVIFLGYPNWWGDMPMALYTFLDEYDFSGKTIIPFCTSGGSALSDTVEAIRTAEPDAVVLDGFHVSGSSAARSGNSVDNWVRSLHLAD
jgi:flavodoxins